MQADSRKKREEKTGGGVCLSVAKSGGAYISGQVTER
jgi:hypothetical protein